MKFHNLPSILTLQIFSCLLWILMLCFSCQRTTRDSSLADIERKASISMASPDQRDIDSLANLLLAKSLSEGNRIYEGKAHFYLSSLHTKMSEEESKEKLQHLKEAERIALETEDDTLLCYIYNQYGAWEMFNGHPNTAQYWFSRSIEKGKELNGRKYTLPAEMNMSEAMRLIGDTIGISYDISLFEYAKVNRKPMHLFSSGLHCALYYAERVNDTTALSPYLDGMRPLQSVFPGSIEMVYAQYYYYKGDYQEAERWIKRASPDNFAEYQLIYADILNKQGRYTESNEWAGKALSRIEDSRYSGKGRLLKLRADNMRASGLDKEAYMALQIYEDYRDSLERNHTLDLTKRYMVEYEVSTKDREILKQKLHIRRLVTLFSIIALFLIVGLFIYFLWQKRRNRLYKDIIRQNKEFIERDRLLSERIANRDALIAKLSERGESNCVENSSEHSEDQEPVTFVSEGIDEIVEEEKGGLQKISEEKINEIFERIHDLAEVKQVWRDVSITRDSFASMVGCNRTYFTEVLRYKTKMSYSQYMNSCRIREAVRILSDPDDQRPLKNLWKELGFLTIQTFYGTFKKAIGMSPSAFRRSVRENEENQK